MIKKFTLFVVLFFIVMFVVLRINSDVTGLDGWRTFLMSGCVSISIYATGFLGYGLFGLVSDSYPDLFPNELFRVVAFVSWIVVVFTGVLCVLLEITKNLM